MGARTTRRPLEPPIIPECALPRPCRRMEGVLRQYIYECQESWHRKASQVPALDGYYQPHLFERRPDIVKRAINSIRPGTNVRSRVHVPSPGPGPSPASFACDDNTDNLMMSNLVGRQGRLQAAPGRLPAALGISSTQAQAAGGRR